MYFNEETRCPYEENDSFAAAINRVLLNNGRKQLWTQASKSATRIHEILLEKRKLGPVVGTTSLEASETENRNKTFPALHEQILLEGTWN